MNLRPFQQVDVFTATPYQGNPVAVVLDGHGLSTAQMQAFTDWTQLSEATFLLPPTQSEADYRVRIFCPGRELPFAGHPTLGSCHAWLAAGGQSRHAQEIVQECGVGLVRIRREGHRLAFEAPPLQRSGPLAAEDLDRIIEGLGLNPSDIVAHAWCDNGPPWQSVMLRSAAQVRQLRPDACRLAGRFTGVVAPHAAGSETSFEVRAFFPGQQGLMEDPVTGSLNAALAQWMIGAGIAPSRYEATQGTALGRAGRVHVQADEDGVWIGGDSVSCVSGTVRL